MTSAFNPESGNISYTYDANSNLKTRTDARIPAVVTTYNYDPLNRVTTRTYSDGTPTVNYVYDTATRGVGRLASVGAVGVSTTNYTEYDRLGRIIQYNQVTDGQAYFMGCAYNKAGLMTSETYPSTKVVVSEYDGAGRLAGVKQQATGLFYAGAASGDATNRMQYTAHGAVSQMKLGNGLWEHTFFNSRLQPTQIGLGTTTTSTSVMGLDYTYNPVGQPHLNNGNILTQTITAPGLNVTQSYTYDHLNRLKAASESGSGWQQTYDYDRYGNRAVLSGSHIPTPALTPQSLSNFNTSNNRITLPGFNYDNGGNLTSDATTAANAMEYDGENRQERYTKGGATTFYEYDGDGQRVKKEDGTGITIFVYNAVGQLVAEYTNGNAATNGTSYLTSDHLGSTRLVTDSQGNVKTRRDYCPFGEEIPSGISARSSVSGYGDEDGIRQKFTGYERDEESGLDFAQARYHSSSHGRFTSPDSVAGSVSNPQTLNLYVYVQNNPLRFIDPTGQMAQDRQVVNREMVFFTDASYAEYQANQTLSSAQFGIPPNGIVESITIIGGLQIDAEPVDNSILGTIGSSIGSFMGAGAETAITADHSTTGPTQALSDFALLSVLGGVGAATSGASLLGFSAATLGVEFLAHLNEQGVIGDDSAIALTTDGKSNVQANKAAGDAFRDEIATLFEEAGYDVQKEVYKKTPFGPRVVDLEISKDGIVLGGIETKVNNSRYKPSQRAKDMFQRLFRNYVVSLVRKVK